MKFTPLLPRPAVVRNVEDRTDEDRHVIIPQRLALYCERAKRRVGLFDGAPVVERPICGHDPARVVQRRRQRQCLECARLREARRKARQRQA